MVDEARAVAPAQDLSSLRGLAVAALAMRPQSRRVRWALTAYTAGTAGWTAAKAGRDQLRKRRSWAIAVNGDDGIYDDVHEWLLSRIPPGDQRALTARTQRGDRFDGPSSPGDSSSPSVPLRFSYDDRGRQSVVIDGHRVDIELTRPELRAPQSEEYRAMLKGEERLTFTARSPAARDAVAALLESITAAHYALDRAPEFHMSTQWGDFRRRRDVPTRPLGSVVLRAGQTERLIEDLQRFFDDEDTYVRLGMPYHRGYLLHGPAGTGKTSVAKVLASHFRLNVYFIPLADLKQDASLMQLVAEVRPGSMLLLEDIDILHASTSREDSPFGISLSGLLNALDGVGTPHGLTVVMTTNDLSRLDPALVRPGRCDVIEEIGWVDDDQLARLFAMFYGEAPANPIRVRRQLAPAAVVEVFKRNAKDLHAAERAVRALA